jgi:hypothetical protein
VTMNLYKRTPRSTATPASCCVRARRSRTCTCLWIRATRARGRYPTAGRSAGASTHARRRPVGDPVLAGHRHPQLPRAAAVRRRAGVPRSRATGAAPSPRAVSDLRGTFKRFAPLNRDTQRLPPCWRRAGATSAARSTTSTSCPTPSGGVQNELASLISASDTNFSAIAANDTQLEQTLTQFPPTLRQTTQTLNKVRSFASRQHDHAAGPAAVRAQPGTRARRPRGPCSATPRR